MPINPEEGPAEPSRPAASPAEGSHSLTPERVRPALSPFQRRLKRIAFNAIAEGANSLFFILLLAGGRWLVEHLFAQSKLFDYLPVRYLFDAGDLAVIGRFIWNTLEGEDKS